MAEEDKCNDGKMYFLYSCFHNNSSCFLHRKNTLPMTFNGGLAVSFTISAITLGIQKEILFSMSKIFLLNLIKEIFVAIYMKIAPLETT